MYSRYEDGILMYFPDSARLRNRINNLLSGTPSGTLFLYEGRRKDSRGVTIYLRRADARSSRIGILISEKEIVESTLDDFLTSLPRFGHDEGVKFICYMHDFMHKTALLILDFGPTCFECGQRMSVMPHRRCETCRDKRDRYKCTPIFEEYEMICDEHALR